MATKVPMATKVSMATKVPIALKAQMAQNDTFENLVLGLKCIGPKYFRTEVLLGPKCASGLSMLGAKVSVGPLGPNWV
jgi:hypothetical protein